MSNDESLILYGMNSPNVRKVAIMLEELDQSYTLRHVAVFKGKQFTPEFLAMNPLGKVPVFFLDGLPHRRKRIAIANFCRQPPLLPGIAR